MKLSTVILTHNSEESLEKALMSAQFSDELIVVDDNSTDSTVTIAKRCKAKVLNKKLDEDFSRQRNFGMNEAKGEWVLFLDSDETIAPNLRVEIQEIANDDKTHFDAYYIKRRDFYWGRELRFGEVLSARNTGFIRLVKKNSGLWTGQVHEIFNTSHKTGKLKGFIGHQPHTSIASFLTKINNYSTFRAQELKERGKKFSLLEMIFIPPSKFFYSYYIQLGFLDGAPGFVYSFMMSFHSFLVRAKLMNL